MLCLLKGSISYFSKLCENITIPVVYEFLRASSYHGATSTGDVKVSYLSTEKFEGKHVIVVEDIIDTGLTLSKIMKMLKEYNPASLEITTLLDKPSGRQVQDIYPKYIGFEIPDEFVLGFGVFALTNSLNALASISSKYGIIKTIKTNKNASPKATIGTQTGTFA